MNNMTFLECVSRCRLREAERRLLFTAESNAGICKACGFSDSKYFYRNFQQEFEMTPSQWKSRWTQGRCPDEKGSAVDGRPALRRGSAASVGLCENRYPPVPAVSVAT